MATSIGRPLDRIDGPAKITGGAPYSIDRHPPGLVHAVLVMSTIARGRILEIDTRDAERTPGVLGVLTHVNAPRLPEPPPGPQSRVVQLLQNDRVMYANQPIAVVIAQSVEVAQEGAAMVRVHYAPEAPEVRLEPRLAQAYTPGQAARPDQKPDSAHGDVEAGLARADVRIQEVYVTPAETHNAMEPHGTVAVWEGDQLTLFDATQGVFNDRKRVAQLLGLRPENVRVVSEYLGG